jgi:hypothetical protein
VRPETLKLLEENIEKTLVDIGIGNAFLNRMLSNCSGNKSDT